MLNRPTLFGSAGSNTLVGGSGADILYGYDPGANSTISATRIATGLNQVLYAAHPPGDASRLFVVQKGGLIKVLDLTTNQVLPTPVLDVSSEITNFGEQGLLGLAFDPNFASNGRFFVYLSTPNPDPLQPGGDVEIRSYAIGSDPNVADPSSMQRVIRLDYPDHTHNHRAGWIGFGPDGFLYVNTGEGSVIANAPDTNSLLGKVLRLDVGADAFPADPDRNYAIPPTNPFAGVAGADEVFAYGLRNPWRSSFDRLTGDLYIGDVGAGMWEEVNIGRRGADYGWWRTEGDFDPAAFPQYDRPVFAYPHGTGPLQGNSVTGGYVYRGPGEGLNGVYVFGDFVRGRVFTLQLKDGAWVAVDRTAEVVPNAGTIGNPGSFAENALGRLYLLDFDGEVYRLTPQATLPDLADTVYGGGGDDLIYGGAGDDALNPGAGDDTVEGGAGADLVYFDSLAPISADLRVAGAQNTGQGLDTFRAVEGFAGGFAADRLIGSEDVNALYGRDGNDVLHGLGGADLVHGGAGHDALNGGLGDDTLDGGAGFDLAYFDTASAVAVDLLLAGPQATGLGSDTIRNVEGLLGGSAADELLGSDLANALYGRGGDDVLNGRGGDDVLHGQAGQDELIGAGGRDRFVFQSFTDSTTAAPDRVRDFTGAEDWIDLRPLDADAGTPGDQAFEFAASFTGQARQAVLAYDLGTNLSTLSLDANGDSAADFVLLLDGNVGTSAGWLL